MNNNVWIQGSKQANFFIEAQDRKTLGGPGWEKICRVHPGIGQVDDVSRFFIGQLNK